VSVFDAEFRILGSLEFCAKGRQVRLRGKKRQIVLSALLLADGKPVPLSRLVDAVWDQFPPTTASKQIRNAVSDLRRILPAWTGSLVTPVADGYRLDLGSAVLDSAIFNRHTEAARGHLAERRSDDAVAEFRAALSLWRGPALAGLASPALQAQLVHLDEQRLAVLEECADLELAQGKYKSLIGELSRFAAEYPFRERLVALQMLALCRSGEQARALAIYEEMRQILEEELGVEPGPELRELRRRIMASDLVVPLPRREHAGPSVSCNSLPGNVGHFTGRGAELAGLLDAVRAHRGDGQAAPAVVAIDGMAGVGKTALAVVASRELAHAYPDAQLFVDLHGHTAGQHPLDTVSALSALLCVLGVQTGRTPPSLDERCAMWRHLLADRRVLIILDNVASAAQISALLPGGPNCLTLVTSRHRLAGLDYTHQLSLSELPVAESRELFGRVLGDERALAEPEAVEAVVEQCGHLPLAIRIAARRLRHRPTWRIAHFAVRLADFKRRLAELSTEDGSMAEVFDVSYRRLAPEHQRLFRLLGLTVGPDIDAQGVADLTGLGPARAEHLMEGLVDAHLLQGVAPGRYRMHELLRAYCTQLAGMNNPVPHYPANTFQPSALSGVMK
jgi:DNA-binding SARP family transcriptional activator